MHAPLPFAPLRRPTRLNVLIRSPMWWYPRWLASVSSFSSLADFDDDKYRLLPTNSRSPSPLGRPSFRQRLLAWLHQHRFTIYACLYAIAVALLGALAAWHVIRHFSPSFQQYMAVRMASQDPFDELNISRHVGPVERSMWGMHEEKGWDLRAYMAEKGLGEVSGAARYRLYHNTSAAGADEYFDELRQFASKLPVDRRRLGRLYRHLLPSLRDDPRFASLAAAEAEAGPPGMINYKHIFQTDKKAPERGSEVEGYQRKWIDFNAVDGWRLRFFNDADGASWMDERFGGSIIVETYRQLHRGVLKADMLRYLLVAQEGGVYSDIDTLPIRPIEHWGADTVEYLDISPTDGPNFLSTLSAHPSVIVGIEIDVPYVGHGWDWYWPRPVQICQWTLAAAPGHPIYLDTLKRIVNATETVQREWGGEDETRNKVDIVSILEWTGPPVFTDAVMQYLQSRYRVSWHRLRGLSHPLRIGDVLVLPNMALSAGTHNDGGLRHRQSDVMHMFRGGWKTSKDVF